MKILQVLHGFPPETTGGTERTVGAWARALAELGHELVIVAGSLREGDPARVDEEEWEGLRVLRMHRDDLYFESWWKSHCPALSRAFAALLERERPDLVHVHHWIRLTTDLVRLARAAGCHTAVTLHDYYSMLADPVRRIGQDAPAAPPAGSPVGTAEVAESFALHRRDLRAEIAAAELRFVPCAAHAQGLRDLGIGEGAAAQLGDSLRPLAPPLLDPPPRARARTPARAENQWRLVTWGSWYPGKGLDSVLAALRQVGPDSGVSLLVFGEAHDPDYRACLRASAEGLPVAFRGAFTPADLASEEADLAVLPSLCHESYGLILDEALCLGWPVLCADVPAYRERLPEGSGLRYPAGDAQALAAILADSAALAALREPEPPRLTAAAESAARLAAAYEEACAGRGSVRGEVEEVTDAERMEFLFRRSERRNWSALQHPDPPPPPF